MFYILTLVFLISVKPFLLMDFLTFSDGYNEKTNGKADF